MRFEQVEERKDRIKAKIAKGVLMHPKDVLQDDVDEDGNELNSFIANWYQKLYDFDFLENDFFEEQIIHSPSRIQIKFGDKRLFDGADLTQDDFQLALEIMCLRNSLIWNYSSPFVSFDLELKGRNFRATLLHHSLCKEHGSKIFLRGHSPKAFDLGCFSDEEELLRKFVSERKNVLLCGGTGSGKTSLLNSMLEASDESEHLVVLEDTFEILSPHENTTRLLARQEHPEDMKDFMAHAMRMSPDRIVVGELRSSEAEPFLLAMNSGHKGLLSTVHANSALDAISRVALLVRLYAKNSLDYNLVTTLACQNIDYVVYMEDKKVKEIIEVFGSEGGQVFYERKDLGINRESFHDEKLSRPINF